MPHRFTDECHSGGTVDHTPVYPPEGFKRALELHTPALILVHNHPSGNARPPPLPPSHGNINITRKMIVATKAVKINVHDHIIVTWAGYNSFKMPG
ncbi:JAB domain-containing protein [Thalassospira sp. MCCC 1A01428]|uniref:JAB domain-containing protein n=1 Tax=Thalassospira sp. MCCC 1A01428 TaxID=1470575 RepID=UPI000A1E57DC|nr:JAB domain-containing protein [Thalassospira sp. MCCC 1A01428]